MKLKTSAKRMGLFFTACLLFIILISPAAAHGFSSWTTGSGYTTDNSGALSFDTSSGISQAYKEIDKIVTKKGDKILIDFELDYFADYSTRTIFLAGLTKDLSFRSEKQGWWGESDQTEGLYLAIHTACFGCLEGYTKPYVFELYANKNNILKKIFNTQWKGVNANCEYGRYLFEVEIADDGTVVRFFKIENGNRDLVKEINHDLDLTGIELNYARVWNDKMQDYSASGVYKGKIYEISISPQTHEETPPEVTEGEVVELTKARFSGQGIYAVSL